MENEYEKLKTSTIRLYFILIIILIIMAGVLVSYINTKTNEPYEEFCIEWDGWISRFNLMEDCYDYLEDKLICQWDIDEELDSRLFIYTMDFKGETMNRQEGLDAGLIREWNCSQYVKMYEVQDGR